MSRLLLLSIFVLWMCPRDNVRPPVSAAASVGLFLGAYAALVLLLRGWSRLLARKVGAESIGGILRRYNHVTELARYFIPAWFATGLFLLGWGHVVVGWLAGLDPAGPVRPGEPAAGDLYWRLPGAVVGTLPALLAWVGLWWAQHPADRALKEQNLLYQANEGLPIHAPPSIGATFALQFRTQLLLTLAPALLIVGVRDAIALFSLGVTSAPLERDTADLFMIPLAVAVFLLAPELLRRIILTEPMPTNDPLRRRLESLCRRTGIRCRDILLWRTHSLLGNAMVMGLFPRVRYIFLSDLLLETMTDEEIEAVFAHEIGHIVHRHFLWFGVFFMLLAFFTAGPLMLLLSHVPGLGGVPATATAARDAEALQTQVASALQLFLFVPLFGVLSRRFERQADAFAARTMELTRGRSPAELVGRQAVVISHVNPEAEPAGAGGLLVPQWGGAGATVAGASVVGTGTAAALPGELNLDLLGGRGNAARGRAGGHGPAGTGPGDDTRRKPLDWHVGPYGASLVVSALHRVARVNNIPVGAHEWLHGSIRRRVDHLHGLAADPAHTAHFDRRMRRLYWGLVTLFVTLAAWLAVQYTMTGTMQI